MTDRPIGTLAITITEAQRVISRELAKSVGDSAIKPVTTGDTWKPTATVKLNEKTFTRRELAIAYAVMDSFYDPQNPLAEPKP